MRIVLTMMILVLVGVVTARAQEPAIKGRVMADSLPMPGATIELFRLKSSVISDSLGFFELKGVPAGKHQVRISMVGHHPRSIQLLAGDAGLQEVYLEKLETSLEEVVVSGTLKAVHKDKSPILVEVYTPQFLKKNPVPSIFEALQNVNGVRPQLNCNVCNTGDIHINGLEGPYTMITIDGMPIVSSLASVYGLFGIPTQLIERVEIVKGPASALYGSEAIGGLINIITRQPEKAPPFTASVMSTSWSEHAVDAGISFRSLPKARTLLGINYFNYQRPVDNNHDQFTDVTLQHRISLFKKTSFQRRLLRVASLAARYFYEDRWGGDTRWNKSFRGGDSIYGESIYTSRWELIGNYQLPVSGRWMFSFSATGHKQDSYYGNTSYQARQDISFGQLTWDKDHSPKFSTLAGLAARYNGYDDNSVATADAVTGENRPERFFLPGLFIQEEWKPDPSHHILVGMRLDRHPVHKNIFTPRVAYKWAINDRQVLRVNAGTGFRVVSLFTEEHAALTGARVVEIREALKPERSYNVNLNLSNRIGKGPSLFTLDLSAWYTHFTNQIIPDYTTDPNKIIYTNLQGYSVSQGFTANVEGHVHRRFKLMAGMTLQDVSRREKAPDGSKLRLPVMLTEKWSGTWSLSYIFPVQKVTIDYTGNIYGPMQLPLLSDLDPRRPTSPVWSIQNLQLTKRLGTQIEIFGGSKNLLNWTPAKNNIFLIARSHDPFDKEVEFDSNGQVIPTASNPYALSFDPAYVYAPNQGRRFFLGIRYGLK